MRPARQRVLAGAAATVAALTVLVGCSPSAEDQRADYCSELKESSQELSRAADEGGAGGFLDALPTLERLAELSPRDLEDEWQRYLGALERLRDALAEADVEAAVLDAPLPTSMPGADRDRISAAVAHANSAPVKDAASGITQHALDICKTQIL